MRDLEIVCLKTNTILNLENSSTVHEAPTWGRIVYCNSRTV